MKLQSAFLATSVALVSVIAACGSGTGAAPASGGSTVAKSGGSSGNGGVTGNGGSAGSGGQAGGSSGSGGALCTAPASVSPCGGGVTGTWTVSSACLSVSGQLDVQAAFGLSCSTGQLTGSLQVTGTWTANADGTFTDGTTTTGAEQLALPSDCKILSKAPVTCERIGSVMQGGHYETVTCTDDASTGGCKCSATVKQSGSMGILVSDPNTSGNYTSASNAITITQDDSKYSYCVAANKLTLTPQISGLTVSGTIVLQNGTSPGTGGSPASGGTTGKGGSSGSGGVNTSGGASSTGGVSASGGAAGRTSQGGAGGVGPGTGGSTARDGGQDVAPGSGGKATGGTTGAGGTTGPHGEGPCDIYAAANVPCAGAYSMVRALSSKYSGFLYQVRSGSSATNTGTGGATQDIGMLADGYADSAAQDAFCTGTTCSVSKLYDQSGNGNDMVRGSKGPTGNGTRSGMDDYEAVANKLSVTAGGHKVYALYVQQYGGYRTALNVTAKGVPTGNKDQGIYMLADGTHFGTQCCWDFGAVSPDPSKYVVMNTLFFGKGFWDSGAGTTGPWFMGDFEGGVWAGGSHAIPPNTQNTSNPAMGVPFALGILHTPVGKYALRMADISTASDLTTAYDGTSPKTWSNAAGITLGVGGDNSNNSEGTFYEGALTNGAPSNATDLLIMKNIQAVGYKK